MTDTAQNNSAPDQKALTERQMARQKRMSILAHAQAKELYALWQDMEIDPECELIRGPETGLMALRGRIGGGGAPFNFGEATVTRATIRLANGTIGHSIMLGRNKAKAKLAAVIDALAEDVQLAEKIETTILAPLSRNRADRERAEQEQAAATKVNFFAMVRGED